MIKLILCEYYWKSLTFAATIARCSSRKIHISTPKETQKNKRLPPIETEILSLHTVRPTSCQGRPNRHQKVEVSTTFRLLSTRTKRPCPARKISWEIKGPGGNSAPALLISRRLPKMADSGAQHCASAEQATPSPYSLSYFTIFLTNGIEILEYYTKVRSESMHPLKKREND